MEHYICINEMVAHTHANRKTGSSERHVSFVAWNELKPSVWEAPSICEVQLNGLKATK